MAEDETPPPAEEQQPPEPADTSEPAATEPPQAPEDTDAADQPATEPPSQPSAEQLEDIAQQIQAIPIDFFLVSTVSTLASIAYARIGETKLDDARAAIDAMRALIPVLEGRVDAGMKRDFDQALANLQLAYADASAKASS